MGARNRVEIGLSLPARQATQPGGIGSLESILGLLESLKIWALMPQLRAIFKQTKESGIPLFYCHHR